MNEEFEKQDGSMDNDEYEKVTVIDQLAIAVSSPKNYKQLTKLPVRKTVGFVFLLTFILIFMEFGISTIVFIAQQGGLKNFFLETLPEFSISDGVLTADRETVIDMDGLTVYINTDYEEMSMEYIDLDGYYLAFGATNAVFGVVYSGEYIDYYDLPISALYMDGTTNDDFVTAIPALYFVLALSYFFYMIGKAVNIIFMGLVFTIMGTYFAKMFITGLSYGNVLRICMYAQTLSRLITSANVCAGYIVGTGVTFIILIVTTFFIMGRALGAQARQV